jgi:hypothetical protein
MLWEAQPEPAIVTRLRSLGLESAVISPSAGRPATGDFLDVIKSNAAVLRRVYGD